MDDPFKHIEDCKAPDFFGNALCFLAILALVGGGLPGILARLGILRLLGL